MASGAAPKDGGTGEASRWFVLLRDKRVVLAGLLPVLFWVPLILGFEPVFWSLVTDDSFYYFQIARNVAHGLGSTFDGLNPTNGYHPLWLAFCVGLYLLGLDGEAAPRAALVAQVFLLGIAWWLLAAAVVHVVREVKSGADRLLEWAALAVLMVAGCVHPLVKVWVNGLESPLVLLFQAAVLGLALTTDRLFSSDARGRRLVLGALLALGFLARIDGALLLPVIVVWSASELRRDFRATAIALVEWLGLPTLVIVTYLALNQVLFGSAIPVSGLLKTAPPELWRFAGAAAVVVGPWILLRRVVRSRHSRTSLLLSRSGFFGLYCCLLVAYYCFLQRFFRLWYFGPVVLYLILIGATALADLFARAARERGSATGRGQVKTLSLLFGLLGAAAVMFGSWQAVTAPSAPPLLAARSAGRFIADNLPSDAMLASWDAGVLGYYSDRSVVNLDGVVNSADYLDALRRGQTAAFLAPLGIGWVVNHSDEEQSLRDAIASYFGTEASAPRVVRTWPFEVFAGVNDAQARQFRASVFLMSLR